MADRIIYHMCRRDEWEAAVVAGRYLGSSQDVADGFIHFSTAEQIRASAARHRKGQDDLVLIAADAAALGTTLKWEPSRGGLLFPHLFGALELSAVLATHALRLGPDGEHVFPELAVDDPAALDWPAQPAAGSQTPRASASGSPDRSGIRAVDGSS